MKKVIAMAMAGMMVASMASATASRQAGFGKSALFIDDSNNFMTLPQVVANEADKMVIEDMYYGGANLSLGPGVLSVWSNVPYTFGTVSAPNTSGMTLNLFSDVLNMGMFNTPTTGSNPISNNLLADALFLTPVNQAYITYALKLEGMTVGVGVNRAANSMTRKYEDPTDADAKRDMSYSSSDLGLSAGLGLAEVGPMSLDLGLQVNMPSAENKELYVNYFGTDGEVTNKVTLGGMNLNVRASGKIAGDEGNFTKIEAGLGMQNASIKPEYAVPVVATSITEAKFNMMAMNVGVAMGKAGEKGLGLLGLNFKMANGGFEAVDSDDTFKNGGSGMNIEAVCGGEAKVKEWLTARAGFSSSLFSSSSITEELGGVGAVTKETLGWDMIGSPSTGGWSSWGGQNFSDATATLGTTVTLGDFSIDGVLNAGFLYVGPYLVSGLTAGPINTQVSLTYAFGGSEK